MLEGNLCAGSGQRSIREQPHLVVYITLLCPTFSHFSSPPTPWSLVQRHRLALAHFNHGSLPLIHIPVAFFNTCSVTKAMTMLDRGTFHPRPLQPFIHSPHVLSDKTTESLLRVWSVLGHKIVCVHVSACLSLLYLSLVVCINILSDILCFLCIIFIVREAVQASQHQPQKAHTLTSAIQNQWENDSLRSYIKLHPSTCFALWIPLFLKYSVRRRLCSSIP